MKPRELITTSIEKTLLEPLSQIGFKFSKSALTFKRKVSDFEQVISFHLNRYNQENVCAEFWVSFSVSSKKYTTWHSAEFGKKPINNVLVGEMHWNIENWKFPIINNKQEIKFQLIDEHERTNVLNILKKDIMEIGIPFLAKFSDWEAAAYKLIEKGWFHHEASDFFQIAEKRDEALWALEQGLNYWKTHPKASFPDHKDEIYLRLEKYFK